jgi:hypothetical protein
MPFLEISMIDINQKRNKKSQQIFHSIHVCDVATYFIDNLNTSSPAEKYLFQAFFF